MTAIGAAFMTQWALLLIATDQKINQRGPWQDTLHDGQWFIDKAEEQAARASRPFLIVGWLFITGLLVAAVVKEMP